MSEEERKRGVVRRAVGGYFGLFKRGFGGALGFEGFRQAKGLAGAAMDAAKDSLRLGGCPRCGSNTLEKVGLGYRCIDDRLCGYQAEDDEQLDAMRKRMSLVDPKVAIVAKSKGANLIAKGKSAQMLAWLAWVCCAGLAMYSLSWLMDGKWVYAIWVGFVTLYCALNAVRYAYVAHLAYAPHPLRKRDFLLKLDAWFPLYFAK